MAVAADPVVPEYEGGCISNVVPELLEPSETAPGWLPAPAVDADQVVLLVLDGLGWDQLQERLSLAPNLAAMAGGAITTVAPSTTATALTSLSTGTHPGLHGIVGYRMAMGDAAEMGPEMGSAMGEVMNVLRWSTVAGDMRRTFVPHETQVEPAFLGHRPPVVTKAEFVRTGFTGAHLDSVRFHGYRVASALVTEVGRLTRSGEPFVYAYYDGLDKVSHEYGLTEYFDAELAFCDRLVGDVLAAVAPGVTVVVTADHGQVDTTGGVLELAPGIARLLAGQSGEGRFRWLHAAMGSAPALYAAAQDAYGDVAWVRTVDQVVADGWFGPDLTAAARARLGDVALVPFADVAFADPADSGPFELRGRHGSLTSAEMLVPLLASTVA